MPDNLSPDPLIFGTLGQSLSDEAGLFLSAPLLELLPLLHESVGESRFAVDINGDGLRTQETGLEAWMKALRDQRDHQQEANNPLSNVLDPVTGYIPTVSSGTTPSAELNPDRESDDGLESAADSSSSSGVTGTEGSDTSESGSTLGPLLPEVIRLEAEEMAYSSGYEVKRNAFASGGKFINLKPRERNGGSAQSEFNGPSGTYAIIVGYYDEADGESTMSLSVGEEQIEWDPQ